MPVRTAPRRLLIPWEESWVDGPRVNELVANWMFGHGGYGAVFVIALWPEITATLVCQWEIGSGSWIVRIGRKSYST